MIGIIDYGMGNLASVQNALHHLGHDASVCNEPKSIDTFDRIILPGVGSFNVAMENLENQGWSKRIREAAATGKPMLGICLGMQLLCTRSDEGAGDGLNLISATFRRFPNVESYPIPQTQWNLRRFAQL